MGKFRSIMVYTTSTDLVDAKTVIKGAAAAEGVGLASCVGSWWYLSQHPDGPINQKEVDAVCKPATAGYDFIRNRLDPAGTKPSIWRRPRSEFSNRANKMMQE